MDGFLNWLRRYRNLIALVLTGLLAQVLINLLSSWLEAIFGSTPGRIFQLVMALGILALAFWLVLRILDLQSPMEIVPQEEKAPRFPGLIALVGPGQKGKNPMEQAAGVALEHHLAAEGAGEPLQEAWLITGRGDPSGVPAAEAFRAQYEERCNIHVCSVADPYQGLQETYAVVRRIYQEEISEVGLQPEQVVADLTGGTGLMTAGMALACRGRWPMEYVTGKPRGPRVPVLIRWQPASSAAAPLANPGQGPENLD